MLKRLLMLSLASLALVLGLRAMVVKTDGPALAPPPVYRLHAVVPALPEEPDMPVARPAPASAVIARVVPVLLVATRAPQADANGLPVAGSPYYRAAYAAFHLPDASG